MLSAPVGGELSILPGIKQLHEMIGYFLSAIARRIDPEVADAAGHAWRGVSGQLKTGARRGEQAAFGEVAK